MQNKRKKEKKKKHITTCDCVTCCCHQCDDIATGLIESSVNIAEEQRSALKRNCTAKTHEGTEEERKDRNRPCHVTITAVGNKNH